MDGRPPDHWPGWHCHRCRSTSCRQRADSDTDDVGRVDLYCLPSLRVYPGLWSHTHLLSISETAGGHDPHEAGSMGVPTPQCLTTHKYVTSERERRERGLYVRASVVARESSAIYDFFTISFSPLALPVRFLKLGVQSATSHPGPRSREAYLFLSRRSWVGRRPP